MVLLHADNHRAACAPHRFCAALYNSVAQMVPGFAAPDLEDLNAVGTLALIDLERLGGIANMAEPPMRLRLHRPDIRVVLLSEEGAHDFGLDRLALVEAPRNNALWQVRMVRLGEALLEG